MVGQAYRQKDRQEIMEKDIRKKYTTTEISRAGYTRIQLKTNRYTYRDRSLDEYTNECKHIEGQL